LLMLSGVFAALGHWQLERLHWKEGLIAQVQTNLNSNSVAINKATDLSSFVSDKHEYRLVTVVGQADCHKAMPVWATSVLGTGYWWMVPVQLLDGSWLWLNRGFVSAQFVKAVQAGEGRYLGSAECGKISVQGLLRTTQTKGGFLRPNAPGQSRWYSRDVVAMTQTQGLHTATTRWFVDQWPAVEEAKPDQRPVPGLTPLHWPNSHLGYALTWFCLSLLSLMAAVLSSSRARHFVVKCSMRINRERSGAEHRSKVRD